MDLDKLKNQWQQDDKLVNPKSTDIMELIQNESNGPVAKLKRSFKRQIVAMISVSILIIATNLQHIEKTFSSVLFWFYIVFCIGVVAFARMNYSVVQKMEGMTGDVKSNLEKQISILESRLRQNLIGIRIALLFFIVLTEVLPYFQYFKMLQTWHSLSPFVRYGAYAALFLFQFFVSKAVSRRKFGRHITHLKELMKQME